jgi:hypothetical protein
VTPKDDHQDEEQQQKEQNLLAGRDAVVSRPRGSHVPTPAGAETTIPTTTAAAAPTTTAATTLLKKKKKKTSYKSMMASMMNKDKVRTQPCSATAAASSPSLNEQGLGGGQFSKVDKI